MIRRNAVAHLSGKYESLMIIFCNKCYKRQIDFDTLTLLASLAKKWRMYRKFKFFSNATIKCNIINVFDSMFSILVINWIN